MRFFSLFSRLQEVLFPDRCVGCSVGGTLLCAACGRGLPPAPACGDPAVRSLYAYADPRVSRLIWLLKYRHARRVADVFAPALTEAIAELLGEEQLFLGRDVLLVPVPISRKRRARRGYNQSELLARAALALLPASGVRIDLGLLSKSADTESQVRTKGRAERLANLGESFATLPGRRSSGETVLLVDDVMTTGATLSACARALARAGFSDIRAITIAH